MARINLSVSDEIKDLMDRWEGVNWSRHAAEAFAFHLEILRLKGENMETAAGIERLRASKRSNSEREHASGYAAGKKWALDTAEYEELERVASLDDAECDIDDPSVLCQAIQDDRSYDIGFMEHLSGSETPSGPWTQGFIQGAKEVFDEV